SNFGTSLALIGSTDLLVAGYHQGVGKNHVELLRECLELRAGRGVSLAAAQSKALAEIPADSSALWVGDVPAEVKKGGPAIFTLASKVVMSWYGTSGSDMEVRFRGSFASQVEATIFKTTLNLMKAVFTNAPEVIQDPELSNAVTEAFRNMRLESDADSITV